jgi:starch-binding outer membrane protein, SusD/RagB family
MKTMWTVALLCAMAASSGCKNLDIPDYYAPSVTELETGAGRPVISVAALGILAYSRDIQSAIFSSQIINLGAQGREGINLDPSNPQQVPDQFVGGTRGPDGPTWAVLYRTILQTNVLLRGLATATGLTDAEREAVRGFAKTMKALSFQRLNMGWDNAGQPIDVDRPTDAEFAPVVGSAQVKAYIIQLLDEAKAHLVAGGSAFPFTLGPGFAGFDTPANFLKFNRALRARAAMYVADYPATLTALSESFIDAAPGASLTVGVYDIYGTRSGDRPNPLYEAIPRSIFSIPQNETEARLQVDGVTLDRRFVNKVQELRLPNGTRENRVLHGITVSHVFKVYNSLEAPVPIIRNEELILLRAEARWLGGTDKAGALADLDYIRVNSGGLAAIATTGLTTGSTDTAFLDELLYNRRYSLLWEGGHRWVDMRRHGRLAQLPKLLPNHKVYVHFQLPATECTPRSVQPTGCTVPPSF